MFHVDTLTNCLNVNTQNGVQQLLKKRKKMSRKYRNVSDWKENR